MTASPAARCAPQGFFPDRAERLPLPPRDAMDEAQRAAADALIAGPRKGVYGPFVPLLRNPDLLSRVGQLGEQLRFHGRLAARLRELATCVAAREASNQFEWLMHAPLAEQAGVARSTLDAIAEGRQPPALPADEALLLDFCQQLLRRHGVADATYGAAVQAWGEAAVVELATLVGYFTMVCWVLNVARTPSLPAAGSALAAFPA